MTPWYNVFAFSPETSLFRLATVAHIVPFSAHRQRFSVRKLFTVRYLLNIEQQTDRSLRPVSECGRFDSLETQICFLRPNQR